MDVQSSAYFLLMSASTRRRLDNYWTDLDPDEDFDPSITPEQRATQIFGAAFERVSDPERGWTLWMQQSDVELDDDEYCRLDIPEGKPLARVRTEVLFDPSLSLEYELLQPEWRGSDSS